MLRRLATANQRSEKLSLSLSVTDRGMGEVTQLAIASAACLFRLPISSWDIKVCEQSWDVHCICMFTVSELYAIVNAMRTERETLETCIANLRALEAIKHLDLNERETGLPPGADAKLVIRTNAGQLTYLVEVKRTVTAAGLEHVLQQLKRYAQGSKARPLLLSNYIPLNLAERLVHTGVNFADAAGNVYLNWPDKLHIQIQGRKPKQIAEAKSERLTQPSGLRVLYALLTQPAENWGAYRDIARACGVALGSIAVVMRELKAKGYLVQERRDEWRLTQKRKLLDLWVEGYGGRLRPELLIGRYQPGETNLVPHGARPWKRTGRQKNFLGDNRHLCGRHFNASFSR